MVERGTKNGALLIKKGHCPKCGPDRFSDVVCNHETTWQDDYSGVGGGTEYSILRCRGCETVFFQTDEVFSEDVDYIYNPHTQENESVLTHKIIHWPSPSKRSKPQWSTTLNAIDDDLGSLFADIYIGLNNDLRVLAAIGMRTAFDRASELLDVDPAKSFREKLQELVDGGKIGLSEKDSLDVLTDAGSAAAHRGWRPSPGELDTMMNIIEGFLHRAFILDKAAATLSQNLPKKQERRTLVAGAVGMSPKKESGTP